MQIKNALREKSRRF